MVDILKNREKERGKLRNMLRKRERNIDEQEWNIEKERRGDIEKG
jgi:hypothetical protein